MVFPANHTSTELFRKHYAGLTCLSRPAIKTPNQARHVKVLGDRVPALSKNNPSHDVWSFLCGFKICKLLDTC